MESGEGLHAETAQSYLTVIFKLFISGLTSIILVVSDTVNLQFQGAQVPISLRSSLRIVAAQANLYAEHIARNAGLEEAQAGIKIAGRNINNLRYADDITLMAESKEELKSLLMKMKESEKFGLKLNIPKIMASGPITSWQADGETLETVRNFYFEGLQNYCR